MVFMWIASKKTSVLAIRYTHTHSNTYKHTHTNKPYKTHAGNHNYTSLKRKWITKSLLKFNSSLWNCIVAFERKSIHQIRFLSYTLWDSFFRITSIIYFVICPNPIVSSAFYLDVILAHLSTSKTFKKNNSNNKNRSFCWNCQFLSIVANFCLCFFCMH